MKYMPRASKKGQCLLLEGAGAMLHRAFFGILTFLVPFTRFLSHSENLVVMIKNSGSQYGSRPVCNCYLA